MGSLNEGNIIVPVEDGMCMHKRGLVKYSHVIDPEVSDLLRVT